MLTAVALLSVTTGIFLIATVVLAILYSHEKQRGDKDRADKVRIVNGVRYSVDDKISKDGTANITLAEGDFLLKKGNVCRAQKDGTLLPGTYTVLAASDSMPTFKLRAGGYVRDYSHGDTVVLADGEEICAVSCNVILR